MYFYLIFGALCQTRDRRAVPKIAPDFRSARNQTADLSWRFVSFYSFCEISSLKKNSCKKLFEKFQARQLLFLEAF